MSRIRKDVSFGKETYVRRLVKKELPYNTEIEVGRNAIVYVESNNGAGQEYESNFVLNPKKGFFANKRIDPNTYSISYVNLDKIKATLGTNIKYYYKDIKEDFKDSLGINIEYEFRAVPGVIDRLVNTLGEIKNCRESYIPKKIEGIFKNIIESEINRINKLGFIEFQSELLNQSKVIQEMINKRPEVKELGIVISSITIKLNENPQLKEIIKNKNLHDYSSSKHKGE